MRSMAEAYFATLLRLSSHYNCRNSVYPSSEVRRFPVGDEQVDWRCPYHEYRPPHYESPNLKNKPWSDPKLGVACFQPQWHQLDGGIDRRSHEKDKYQVLGGVPRNPVGRTGLTGRGLLGRWGPNHAADPVVTRWKREDEPSRSIILHHETNLPILQFCAIQRRDNNQWAIPGGMVDPNEQVTQTLMREFMEETMNSLDQSPENSESMKRLVIEFFSDGKKFYEGYVDDPRNTDNAWMETVASNFHDETGEIVGKLNLSAGDDAKAVRWMDIDNSLALYASHKHFIEYVAKMRGAHFG